MPKKVNILKKVEEPAPEPEILDESEESEEEPIVEIKPKKTVKKAVKKAELMAPKHKDSESEGDESEDSGSVSDHKPKPKARARKAKAEPKAPSLWLTCLREHGFMTKGAGFKPTPKKGSAEYDAVRKTFDERKAAAASAKA